MNEIETPRADLHQITQDLAEHYGQKFEEHGATPRGVDWGSEADLKIRYDKMLEVIPAELKTAGLSLLDVGCGYGGLLAHAREKGFQIQYTGIDAASNLVDAGRMQHPESQWIHGDVLTLNSEPTYDFVACNGILTQKLHTSQDAMDAYANTLAKKLFAICRRGVAFNVMSTHVNFTKDNLYHRDPAEFLGYCLREITWDAKLDHSYPLYEYTIFLFHEQT